MIHFCLSLAVSPTPSHKHTQTHTQARASTKSLFWQSSESQNNLSLSASFLMAVQCNLRNSGCGESSFECIWSVSFLLSLFLFFSSAFSFFFFTVSSVHQVHIHSEPLSWALNCHFCLPDGQCTRCNLAMQDLTRQRILQASCWHARVSAAGIV